MAERKDVHVVGRQDLGDPARELRGLHDLRRVVLADALDNEKALMKERMALRAFEMVR